MNVGFCLGIGMREVLKSHEKYVNAYQNVRDGAREDGSNDKSKEK